VEEGIDDQPEEGDKMVLPPAPESKHLNRGQRTKRKKLITWIAAGVAVALILLGGFYWLFIIRSSDKNSAKPKSTSQNKTASPTPTSADPTPVTYKSTKLNIELTHRKDWTLKESTSVGISVTSPTISYVKSDGQSSTGVFTVKIRRGVTDSMQATIDKAFAPRDSEVIAYTAPTDQQRQYTNLSYAGQKDFFSFFIVTGNTTFKAGGAFAYSLPLDGDFYLIVGGYGADQGDSLSFDSVPKDYMDSTALDAAIDIVKSIKIY
jgi:hypothetical protein